MQGRDRFTIDYERMVVFVVGLFLLYNLLPILPVRLPSFIKNLIVLIIRVMPIFLVLLNRKIVNQGIRFILITIIFFMLLYYGQWRYVISLTNFVSSHYYFAEAILLVYLISQLSNKRRDALYNFAILLFIVTSITTLVGLVVYPTAMRSLAGSVNADVSIMYTSINMGGYSFVYGSIIAIPSLFYKLAANTREGNKHAIVLISIIVLFSAVVFMSQYTTAFVLLIFVLIFSIVSNIDRTEIKVFLWVISIVVLFVLINHMSEVLSFLLKIANNYGLDKVAMRISEVISFNRSDVVGVDMAARQGAYTTSWNAFINSPIWGNLFSNKILGGHSEILDVLAGSGVIGFAFMLRFLFVHSKEMKAHKASYRAKVYRRMCLIVYITLLCINTVFNSAIIAISYYILPSLLLFNYENKEDSLNESVMGN